MINDAFAVAVHSDYRRHELLAAAMRQVATPRHPRGFGAHQIRALVLRLQGMIGREPRATLPVTEP